MDSCEGYFTPNATTPNAGYNVTNCTTPLKTGKQYRQGRHESSPHLDTRYASKKESAG